MGALRAWQDHLPSGDGGMAAADLDLLAGRSLTAAWREHWVADPGRVVVRGPDGAELTAGALAERSTAAARRLAAAGVVPGDRVVVSAAASVDHVVAYVGVLRLGAVAVPVNGGYREREVAHVVTDARPVAAVTDDGPRASWMRARGVGVITHPDLGGLPAAAPGPVALDGAGPGAPALLCYTSGTTGAPKGALLRHGNLLASAEALRLAWRWTPEDRLVLALPLFHMHGLGVGIHGTLTAGATALLFDGFDAGAFLEAVAASGTMVFGVPTMWHRLAAHPAAGALARLRLAVSGSAPLPAGLHAAVAAVAGRPPVERYGMTETVMLTSNPYDGERRAGSVGFPLPGVEVRLAGRDPAGGPAGAAAEIEVRGPNVFRGYWERPAADAAAFRDGWFRTGDLGEADDGYLRIVGRAKELIISGGYNVYPGEVEEVLRAHPGVDDAAVVGTPDPEWGERVCAVVVPAGAGAREDELAAWCAERLAPYKRPRRWAQAASLPRNALGKVLRDEVAALL